MIERLPLSGTLTAPRYANLTTRLSGSVDSMSVDVGSQVDAGEPLLQLDEKLAQLELARIESALRRAEILQADAERLVEEARELTRSNNISQTEFDSRAALASAEGAVVEQLRSERDTRKEQLQRHTLRAPYAGVIAEKMTEVGEWVREDTPVLALAQMDPLYIDIRVPQRYAGRLRSGSELSFGLSSLGSEPRSAKIERTVPVSDPATRTFLVRAVVANPDWALLPGMSIRAELPLAGGDEADALQVPADAIVRRSDGSSLVWRVREANGATAVEPVSIQIGREVGSRVEVITDELGPGDRVVTLGNESLVAGQAIAIE